MGEMSLDGYVNVGRTQLGLRFPELPPARTRGAALRWGKPVPVSEKNVAMLEVTRGSFLHASMLACSHCPSVLTVFEHPKRELGSYATSQGWKCARASHGWLCPGCVLEFEGGAA
ncbi:MAG: hypothetical protein AB7I04_18330 [Pseudomonadales bacterium]